MKVTKSWSGILIAFVVVLALPLVAAEDHGFSSERETGYWTAPGGTYTHKFSVAGTYTYHSTSHENTMKGTIYVYAKAPASTGPVEIQMKNNSFVPAFAHVRPGGVVRWTNMDPVNHTVMEDHDSPGPELVYDPDESPDPTTSSGGKSPGFPLAAVSVGLAATVCLAFRRR